MRALFRERRQQISADVRHQSSLAARDCLAKESFFKKSKSIACYLATPHEFDTQSIIEEIWQEGKKCYLPVLTSDQQLEFVLCDQQTALVRNAFNIFEPADKNNILPLEKLDLVLLPLVAFDVEGHRLGAGGGFYDRTFAEVKKRPLMIGVGFACQQAAEIPVEEWDVKLDGVLTETGMIMSPRA